MKYFLILNPGSHSGRGKRSYLKLLSILDKKNINYEFKIPESFGEIIKISAEANKDDYDVIVSVGGDGTINNVINGFYDKNGKRISKTKMGIIYTGTSPDFCKSYNIPFKNLNRAVEILLENETRHIQIGKIQFRENLNLKIQDINQSELVTKYFACCANIGLGATLADFANRGIRRILGDLLGTLFSLFRTLIIYKPVDLEIISDEKSQKISRVYNISIGLTYYIASGIKVKNELKDNDNRFYWLTVRNLKAFNFLSAISSVYSGKQIRNSDIIQLDYFKKIKIKSKIEQVRVEFDGDPQGYLPCSIEMAEDNLELIIGKNNE